MSDIRMQNGMLYGRYIIFRHKNQEILAIDANHGMDKSSLYLWELTYPGRYLIPDLTNYDLDGRTIRIIGVDLV